MFYTKFWSKQTFLKQHKYSISIKIKFKFVKKPTAFEKFPEELELIFREIWTKNADVVSILYTGTGALKTDFTK